MNRAPENLRVPVRTGIKCRPLRVEPAANTHPYPSVRPMGVLQMRLRRPPSLRAART